MKNRHYGDQNEQSKHWNGKQKMSGDKDKRNVRRTDSGNGGERNDSPYWENSRQQKQKPSYDKRETYTRNLQTKDLYDDKLNDNRLDRRNQSTESVYEVQAEENAPLLVYGRNPVREAIKSGKSIDKIFVTDQGSEDGSLREIIRMARERKLVITEVSKIRLDQMSLPYGYQGKAAPHQGIIAQMPAVEYVEIEDILAFSAQRNEKPFILLLDGILDPHNLGAILRASDCAGVHGVVIPKRRSVSVTAAAAKASAGAAMHVSVARVPNLSQAVQTLKEAGLWIAGADMKGTPMWDAAMDGPLALIIGGEENGISSLLAKKCDFMVSIPMFGQINSLNASNAASVLSYEKVRQDLMKKKENR